MAYDIFPPWLIQHAIYPEDRIGGCSLVVQRVVLGPLALEMAVRVFGVWSWRRGGVQEAGFSYVTLKGHPECGAETFRVSIDADEYVTVRIEARSRPGLLLTRLGLPAARLFQRAITRAAIRRLTRT